MKKITCLSGLAIALVLLFSSCSDKDHFDSVVMGDGATLWENINSDGELSNFAAVLEATGYASRLATSQVFTVFAPVDEKFTVADRDRIIALYNAEKAAGVKDDKNTAITEFVQNHIALYNYTVSDVMEATSLRMMNGKGSWFTPNSLQGVEFQKKNILASNGVLYTLRDKVQYYQNIYEYIKNEKGGDKGLDSLYNFLYHYHFTTFIPEESVKGEIVDGKQQYLDSVTTVNNEILDEWIKAKLDSEDSSYYAVLPTNKAWKEQYDVNKYFFKYVRNSQSPDSVVSSELRDSFEYILPRYNIIAGAQFSRTNNQKLGTGERVDSVKSPLAVSYGYRKLRYGSFDKRVYEYMSPYEVKLGVPSTGIFVDTDSSMCSNGVAFKANEWKIKRENTFLQDLSMEAEANATLDSLYYVGRNPAVSGRPKLISRDAKSSSPFYDDIMGHTFCKLESNNPANMSGALFNFTDVLSNVWYDLYVCTVPSTAYNKDDTDILPTRIQCTIYCKNPEGLQDSIEFKTAFDPSKTYGLGSIKVEDFGEISIDDDYTRNKPYSYETDPTQVHKLRIGRIKFPTCTWGLPDPMVKLRVEVNVLTTSVGATKSNMLYLDRILLSPVIDKTIEDIKNNQ